MGTPTLTSIRENLVTSLAAINGTGVYVTTIANVRRWNRPPVEISPTEMPLVGFESGSVEENWMPFHTLREWKTTILGFVRGATEAATDQACEDLVEDIKYAVMGGENYRRGGFAIGSKVEAWRFAEYQDRLQGQVAVDIVVRYQSNRDRE